MNIYSISDIYPLFEDMHDKIGLSSERFLLQNEIARNIWLAMRIDGEIKNGGVAQLFFNLRFGFDSSLFAKTLEAIGSTEGAELLSSFNDFLDKDEKRKKAFYEEAYFGKGFPRGLKTLHDKLSSQYYKLDPNVEGLIIEYAEKNWADADFQKAIAHLSFQTEQKDETELIANLNDALHNGSVSTTKKILKKLSHPNQACKYGTVPFLELAANGESADKQIELAKLLLAHKANINIQNDSGLSALHKAAYNADLDFIKFLLENGANLELADNHGQTPIFEARGNPVTTEFFIKKGVKLNLRSKNYRSPLSTALSEYSGWIGNKHAKKYQPKAKKVIDLLLKAGAKFYEGLLFYGSETELSKFIGDADMLTYLLQQKGMEDTPEFNPNHGGWSAVFEAAHTGDIKCLKALIAAGACLNSHLAIPHYKTKTFAGATPLSVAKNKSTVALLEKAAAIKGERTGFVLYMETRGTEAAALPIIQEYLGLDIDAAKEKWATVKRVMDTRYEEIDGKYVIYQPLLLKSFDNESDMEAVIQSLDAAGCAYTVI